MNDQILIESFQIIRNQSVEACKPLEIEDYGLQASMFVSPPKWHLAHTTWFFETFILSQFVPEYTFFNSSFKVLFNSYYNAVGEQYSRPQRGLLSRPTVSEVLAYRAYVDEAMTHLLAQTDHCEWDTIKQRCLLGIEHEKQHQELFFTDLKFSFSKNPLFPAYREAEIVACSKKENLLWLDYSGGLVNTGVDEVSDGFSFDNEAPSHKVYIEPFSLSNRLVTNGEYKAFINDGAYQKPEYWLSDGWATLQKNNWKQPLYWLEVEGKMMEFTLYGLQELREDQPVCHISGYEADAYANWANARLLTEAEWEFAAKQHKGRIKAVKALHPEAADLVNSSSEGHGLMQLYDSCWQWTASAYRPYPGFQVADGAIGEYNGKFMCNQWVLRGGSCVSSENHLRPSYRNFFYPEDRWQFSGIRLAKK